MPNQTSRREFLRASAVASTGIATEPLRTPLADKRLNCLPRLMTEFDRSERNRSKVQERNKP